MPASPRRRPRTSLPDIPVVSLEERLYVGEAGAALVSARFDTLADPACFLALADLLSDAALARRVGGPSMASGGGFSDGH